MPAGPWRRAGLALIVLWFTLGGVAHFIWPARFVSAIPPALPWREAAVYISGFFELLGAVGVLLPRWRRAAGIGLAALVVCVTPANVYMWCYAERFPHIPEVLLLWRLPLQLLLLLCIVTVTQPRRRERSA